MLYKLLIITLKIGDTTSTEPCDSADCVCICLDGLRCRGLWLKGGMSEAIICCSSEVRRTGFDRRETTG